MSVAIVGAGPSGLLTARRLQEHGYKYDILEQAGKLGGNWVYTDDVGIGSNGLQSTCMYKDLITNVPKELMVCPGFPFPENKIQSYIGQVDVLEYYNNFAETYNLKKSIQYFTRVTKIRPFHDKWSVITQNLNTKKIDGQQYDYVFICNGRFSFPFVPKICGDHLFRGIKMHSCNFRTPEKCFENKRVLIIGGKTSGQDLTSRILQVAEHVYLSTRELEFIDKHKNLTIKTEVLQITENEAIFNDESTELVDVVLYCTGYLYKCPFINNECGVTVENNGVTPLYKQIINIERPTMYFIGIPYMVTGIPVFDLQARFCIAVMENKFLLPSKEDMLSELKDFIHNKEKKCVPKKHIFKITTSVESKEYCQDLSKKANIPSVPLVLFNLFDKIRLESSRKSCYKVIDEETFIEIDSENELL